MALNYTKEKLEEATVALVTMDASLSERLATAASILAYRLKTSDADDVPITHRQEFSALLHDLQQLGNIEETVQELDAIEANQLANRIRALYKKL